MLPTSDFVLGGLSSVGATCFTNPIEVIKTRIQLQGELASRGTYVKPYKSVVAAFITVAKNESITGLQKGLVPALFYQFITNSCRLSLYTNAIRNGWAQNKKGEMSFVRGLFWGGIGGVIGGFCASPFFMIKIQMQAQAAESVRVGHQHHHTGMLHAFKKNYRNGGIFALWYGAVATIPRSLVSSGTQIATFGWTKEKLRELNLVTTPTLNSFCGGLLAGTICALATTPTDVITTRLYNQHIDERGRGAHYNGWLDCFRKIFKSEGIYGLYKGFWPSYLRLAPQSTITLLIFDELIAFRDCYSEKIN